MFSSKATLLFQSIVLSALTLTGCQSLKDWEGNYHGYQYSITNRVTHNSEHIEVDVAATSKTALKLKFISDTAPRELELNFDTIKSVTLTDKAYFSGAKQLTRESRSDDCFSQILDESHSTTLCYDNKDAISLVYFLGEGNYYRVVISKRAATDLVPKLEDTTAFTSEELFKRALDQSFESRIEINRVIQAKKTEKLAWLSLTPHLNLGDAAVAASTSGIGLLVAAGDLVPFLFPNHWYAASEKKQLSQAEQDAYVLLKSDTANGLANLCMAYQMDKEIVAAITEIKDLNAELLGRIVTRENLGLIFPGTHFSLAANLNNLEQTLITLRRGLIADRNAIALAAGFYNPFAIDQVTFNFNADINNPAPIDMDSLLQEVYDHSYELKQMDHIVEAYRYSMKARKFTWMDPAGDIQGGIGAGLPVYIGIGKYQVKEWDERREQLKAILIQKVSQTYNNRKMAIDLYAKSAQGLELQNSRIATLQAQLTSGTNFDPIGFVIALRDLVDNQVNYIAAKYSFYMAQEQLDRARMSGHYEAIPFDTQQQSRNVK